MRQNRPGPQDAAYEITDQIMRSQVPFTIAQVVKDLSAMGCDCGSVVRKPTPSDEAGLLVILLTKAAADKIVPTLQQAAYKVGQDYGAPHFVGRIKTIDPIPKIFEMMQEKKLQFFYCGEDGLVCVFFLSQECAEFLAPRLTELGCPTSLT